MFTGIVTDMGKVVSILPFGDGIKFTVESSKKYYLKKNITGQSMAINGACMTIENIKDNRFNFTTIKESLSKTNLSWVTTRFSYLALSHIRFFFFVIQPGFFWSSNDINFTDLSLMNLPLYFPQRIIS